MKIRVVVISDGERWIAHGESDSSDSRSLQHMEVESDPQWVTNLAKDMICVVEAEIQYTTNRLQRFKGKVRREGGAKAGRVAAGVAGGRARAASMTAERRSEIAKSGAAARWKHQDRGD